MPIYAYKCAACGHAADALQKMSDPALTICPACGAEAYSKQLTAPQFQLKGSGWYVTDFRDGKTAGKDASKDAGKEAEGAKKEGATAGTVPAASDAARAKPAAESTPATTPAPAPVAATPAPAAPSTAATPT
jgi:putative FmdB family regulatory protein